MKAGVPESPAGGRRPLGESQREVLAVAGGGALNMAGALFSQVAFFAVTLLLARVLGRSAVGRYSQAFAFLSLLGLLSLSGFRAGLTRFVAVHLADDDPGSLRGTVRLGLGLSMGASALLSLALLAVAPWLAVSAFDDPRLVAPLRFVAAILPASVFTDAALSATQGFRTMKPYAIVGLVSEPAVRLALTAGALAAGAGLEGAMVALVVSNYAAAVMAAAALRRLMGRPRSRPRYNVGELFGFSAVSWLASLASTGLIWADTILLGVLRSSADVGVYQVATRMVMLASFVMLPINASFAPHIADLYRRGRWESLRHTYSVATSWILRLSLPAFVACLVLPRPLLSLFGSGFEVGAAVTVILACGKLVDSATGPCGLMLNMSGRARLSLLDNAVALVANVLLNLWLIPRHGIVGSAVAWAVSLGLVNVARVVQVRWTMGTFPFDAGVAKAVAAGLAAAAGGLLARGWADGVAELLTGVGTIGAVYVGVLLALGVTEEDRLVLTMFRERLRGGTAAAGGRRFSDMGDGASPFDWARQGE